MTTRPMQSGSLNRFEASSRRRFDRLSMTLGLLFVSVVLVTTGCATDSASRQPETTSDGMVMVTKTRQSTLWVKPDHHLGRYDNLLVNRIGFGYAKHQERLGPEDEAELARMLKGVILGLTQDGPVGIVTQSGPCVVAINLGMKDLRLVDLGSADSTYSFVSSFGSTTLIIEFVDSLSGEMLVRYVARRELGGGRETARSGVDLKRLGRALGGIVADMNKELQKIIPTTTSRPETECNDGIYKLTGRDR